MEFKNIQNMTLDEKRAYLVELKAERQRIETGEQLRKQSGGIQAAAEAMMPYDPTGAFNLMDKRAQTDIDRQRVMLQSQNKGRVQQLEQLWKDATRSLRQARIDRDQPSIDRYEAQIAGLETQLGEIAPDTWGEPPNATVQRTDPSRKQNVADAVAEGEALVDAAMDKDKNGVIDDVSKLDNAINKLVTKYNISDAEIATVKQYLEAKKEQVAKDFTGDREKDEASRASITFGRKLADDKAATGTLLLAYDNLVKNPADKTAKSSALTSILRKESGAAIGQSEFMGRMKEWLPPTEYQRLQDDMSGMGMLIAGKLAPNAAELWSSKIADKYLDKVDARKMLTFLDYMIPDYAKNKSTGDKKDLTGGLRRAPAPAPAPVSSPSQGKAGLLEALKRGKK